MGAVLSESKGGGDGSERVETFIFMKVLPAGVASKMWIGHDLSNPARA